MEQIEGSIWLQCERPWNRSERRAIRRRRPSGYRRHLKRSGVRLMRRLGNRFLDDAPKRLAFRGYEY